VSIWNIKPRKRTKTIIIKKIIQRWPEYAAGFPGMEILDTEGKRHAVAFVDLSVCSLEDWEQITEGRRIRLIFRDVVVSSRLLPARMRVGAKEKTEGPKSPYYRWTCLACKKTDIVDYGEWEEPFEVGTRIVKAHNDPENLQIIDHNGQDKTEGFRQVMGIISSGAE